MVRNTAKLIFWLLTKILFLLIRLDQWDEFLLFLFVLRDFFLLILWNLLLLYLWLLSELYNFANWLLSEWKVSLFGVSWFHLLEMLIKIVRANLVLFHRVEIIIQLVLVKNHWFSLRCVRNLQRASLQANILFVRLNVCFIVILLRDFLVEWPEWARIHPLRFTQVFWWHVYTILGVQCG